MKYAQLMGYKLSEFRFHENFLKRDMKQRESKANTINVFKKEIYISFQFKGDGLSEILEKRL